MTKTTLTGAAAQLYDDTVAAADGRDMQTVLDGLPGSTADKADVAEQLGGSGAGRRYHDTADDSDVDVAE